MTNLKKRFAYPTSRTSSTTCKSAQTTSKKESTRFLSSITVNCQVCLPSAFSRLLTRTIISIWRKMNSLMDSLSSTAQNSKRNSNFASTFMTLTWMASLARRTSLPLSHVCPSSSLPTSAAKANTLVKAVALKLFKSELILSKRCSCYCSSALDLAHTSTFSNSNRSQKTNLQTWLSPSWVCWESACLARKTTGVTDVTSNYIRKFTVGTVHNRSNKILKWTKKYWLSHICPL